MTTAVMEPKPPHTIPRTSSISAMATSRYWRACSRRAAQGRSRRWLNATAAPGVCPTARPSICATNSWPRTASSRLRSNSFGRYRGEKSGIGAGHQLRRALGQAPRRRPQDPARPRRPVRPVERRPSGDAGRHAPARSALRGNCAAGRLAASSTPACPASCMSSPVINPLSRYRHAKRALAGADARSS